MSENHPARICDLIRREYGWRLRGCREDTFPDRMSAGGAFMRLVHYFAWDYPNDESIASALEKLGVQSGRAIEHAKEIIRLNDFATPNEALTYLEKALAECDQALLASIT